eukprot:scaffold81088_cov60-Cyclotella_meneghiniana.AAC.8
MTQEQQEDSGGVSSISAEKGGGFKHDVVSSEVFEAGPSTPSIPLLVGSCRDSRAGSLPLSSSAMREFLSSPVLQRYLHR